MDSVLGDSGTTYPVAATAFHGLEIQKSAADQDLLSFTGDTVTFTSLVAGYHDAFRVVTQSGWVPKYATD